jgi:hypothetical protein
LEGAPDANAEHWRDIQEQTMKNILVKGIAGLGMLGSLALAGCGTELDADDVETETSAFTAAQCQTASPVATFTGAYTWNSPSSYGTGCNAVDETSGGSSLYLPYGSYVLESNLPTTKAACEATTIRSVFYRTSGGAWVIQKDESHSGVWGPIPINRTGCSLQGTSFPVPGVPKVRVATTVRRASGSSFVTLPFTTTFQRKPR